VTLSHRFDGSDPFRADRIDGQAGWLEERRAARSGVLATGTLACPACDVPVSPGAGIVAPAHQLECPYCGHVAAVRDFLSLATPSRPARVEVRVVHRARRALR
jgi:hypothetical protein